MKIQIDQSGRIEYTSKNTVVAFSDGKNKSILIKAKDKRKLQKIFREHKQGRIFIYKAFASLIYFLIKEDLDKISRITIDQEYPGHEAEIKHYLLQIIRKANKDFSKDNIVFKQIGKKSHAHLLAYKVYRKKASAEVIVNINELAMYLFRLT